MFQTENLQEKWQPVLEHPDLGEIKDSYRKAVTTVVLENQEKAMKEDNLMEAAPTNNISGGNIGGGVNAGWDPILISLVRRALPNMIAYDICGVQPMTGPTGLIFAMRSRFTSQSGDEALFNEADTDHSANDAAGDLVSPGSGFAATNPAILNDSPAGNYSSGVGLTTAQAEALGDAAANAFAEMAFSIDKVTVTAKSRALKAEYTMDLAQDLKAIHGLDADSNGRWSVEKFKGLMFQLERDANAIGQKTRRGKGNIIITSADVASALQMAGILDYAPALNNNLNVDDTANTFAGVLNGRFKVYVDPYAANVAAKQYYVVGYKGTSPYDAGLFYCPYVPLQMVRAVGQDTFQPKIGFKTRYGMVQNPFANSSADGSIDITAPAAANQNFYYRRVQVTNLM